MTMTLVTPLHGVSGVLALAYPSSNSRPGLPLPLGNNNLLPYAATSQFTRFNDPTSRASSLPTMGANSRFPGI
jgi:hypothetical protein